MRPDRGVGRAAAMDLLLTTTSLASAVWSTLAVVAATTSRHRSSRDNTSASLSGVCYDRFLKGWLNSHNRVLINGMRSS
ncbi:MAG: hypothetical protein LH631_12725 [Alkalinema sp. CAN_BIN05]|nr:hypothetical protein [Alkalinema sp. CAN_BIN05]